MAIRITLYRMVLSIRIIAMMEMKKIVTTTVISTTTVIITMTLTTTMITMKKMMGCDQIAGPERGAVCTKPVRHATERPVVRAPGREP